MATDPFVSPQHTRELPRDGKGRPLVWLPDGSKQVGYSRCTSFIACLEDQYAVHLWQQRMVAIGLAERPDLLVSVAAYRDDRERLNTLVDQAREAAKANAAARTGTALHSLVEQYDRGESPLVPPAYRADVDAYRHATADLDSVHIEQFCVEDALRIGGTPDRVVRYHVDGKHYIADVKTGSIDYGHLKFSMQFAVYANSHPYDPFGGATGHRWDWPEDLDRQRAILIHLPQGQGTCDLYWVNIAAGWQAVHIARAVRAWRNRKGLMVPFTGHSEPPAMNETTVKDGGIDVGTIRMLITTAHTADGVRQLYRYARKVGIDVELIVDECTQRVRELERA
jgi:hypothetical protein